jgi:hypothetical protein
VGAHGTSRTKNSDDCVGVGTIVYTGEYDTSNDAGHKPDRFAEGAAH